jgi:hypothetical protein
VPLDASGYFFEPLWTNFRFGDDTGILDWYTILVSVLALLALMMHGGIWVQMKTSEEVSARAGKLAERAWWGVVALTALVTAVAFWNSAAGERKFHNLAAWIHFSAACGGRHRGRDLRIAKGRRTQSVPCVLRLPDRHVDKRRFWRIPNGFAGAESDVLAQPSVQATGSESCKDQVKFKRKRTADGCCGLVQLCGAVVSDHARISEGTGRDGRGTVSLDGVSPARQRELKCYLR